MEALDKIRQVLTPMLSLCMRTAMSCSSGEIVALVTWTAAICNEKYQVGVDGDHEGEGWNPLSTGRVGELEFEGR